MRHGLRACILSLCLASLAISSPGEAVTIAAADIGRMGQDDRPFYRYLWAPVAVLSGPDSVSAGAGIFAELMDIDGVLRFHANELSTKGAFENPARVSPHVWRVDLRKYGWDADTWEKFAKHNFYFNQTVEKIVVVKNKKKGNKQKRRLIATGPAEWLPIEPIRFLIQETGSATPIVSAPWWLANTCRQLTLTNKQLGFGYYDWLGIKNRNDFFKLADVRLRETRKRERDGLEVVSKSGVSTQNRQIETDPTINGQLFFTLDTDDESGAGNAVRNLRRGDYVHQAEEHYLPLPNGLPAYLLCDAAGVLQPSAPDFIGPDKSPLNQSTDGRIHVCLACIRCHAGDILKPVPGWARKNFRIDRSALNVPAIFKHFTAQQRFDVFAELERQYLKLNFNNELNEQRQRYRFKIQECCGLDAGELAKRFARVYHAYADTLVTLDQAARELGYPPEVVRKAFIAYGEIDAVREQTGPGAIDQELAALVANPGEAMPRLHWEGLYAEAQHIMLAYNSGEKRP